VDEQLCKTRPLTQFEMIIKQIGVTVIHAYSPQAKGRGERSFQTFQDRLVKEMRLKNIKTIPDANVFLRWLFLNAQQKVLCCSPKKSQILQENFCFS